MSRGPGIWQRAILRAADDGLAGTVCAIVKGCVTEPSRSDHVCARRSLKTLAIAGRVGATYLYGCPACGTVRQAHGCCGQIRPMLGFAPAGTQPPSMAPPPVRPVPGWLNAAPPGPALPAFEVASTPALLQLLIQRGYERLAAGEMTISSKDLLAALRLQAQFGALRRDQPGDRAWQDAMVTLLDAAKEHLGPDRFRDFLADVRDRPGLRVAGSQHGQQAALTGGPATADGCPRSGPERGHARKRMDERPAPQAPACRPLQPA